jgi:hypothetical protein
MTRSIHSARRSQLSTERRFVAFEALGVLTGLYRRGVLPPDSMELVADLMSRYSRLTAEMDAPGPVTEHIEVEAPKEMA